MIHRLFVTNRFRSITRSPGGHYPRLSEGMTVRKSVLDQGTPVHGALASGIAQIHPVPKDIENRMRAEGWIALLLSDSFEKAAGTEKLE